METETRKTWKKIEKRPVEWKNDKDSANDQLQGDERRSKATYEDWNN